MKAYTRAIDLGPDEAASWRQRAFLFQTLNQFNQAIADFSKAIELKPDDGATWNWRGIAYYKLRQWHKAIADYSQAIDLNQDQAVYWSNRGISYRILGLHGKAIADLSKAIAMKTDDPDHLDTLRTVANLGVSYRDAGRFTESIRLLEGAYHKGRKQPSLAWVGRELVSAYILAGKTAEARVLHNEELAAARRRLKPDSLPLAGQLAQAAPTCWLSKPSATPSRSCVSASPSAPSRSPKPGRRSTPDPCWAAPFSARRTMPTPSPCLCKATRA